MVSHAGTAVQCPLSQAKADHTPPAFSPAPRTPAASQPGCERAGDQSKRVGLAVSIASNAEFLAAEEPQLLRLVAARQPIETFNLHRVDGEINRATFPSSSRTILNGSENTLNKPAYFITSPVSSRTSHRRASSPSTLPPPTRPRRPQPLRRSRSSAPSRYIRASTPQRRSVGSVVERRGPGRRTRPRRLQTSSFGSQERPGNVASSCDASVVPASYPTADA